MSAPVSCEEPGGGWVRSEVVRRLAAILEGSRWHVPHLGKGALVRFAERGRGWQCSRGPRAWVGYYPSLYVRMSGELSRPIDIASGESGGRLGGFRTGRVGMCRTLGRGLGGGDDGGDEATSASARGFARHLGRACCAQVMVGRRRLRPKS